MRDCHFDVSEEIVERYCLGHLAAEELDRFEEHLLVCPDCQQRVTEAERYIRAMKSALRQRSEEEEEASEQKRAQPPFWNPKRWNLAWAAGLAAVAAGLFLYLPAASDGTPQQVTLRAIRGFDEPAAAAADKGGPLVLKADLAELPQLASYTMEVVDAGGERVWQAQGQASAGFLTAAIPRKLPAGRYWVRISGEGTLLREFGLKVE